MAERNIITFLLVFLLYVTSAYQSSNRVKCEKLFDKELVDFKFARDLEEPVRNLKVNFKGQDEDMELPRPGQRQEKSLTMCVLNQRNSNVIFHREFPLFQIWGIWSDLKLHLANISPERIVILHAEGDSIYGMRDAINIVTSLGSVLEEEVLSGSRVFVRWTWVFIYGGKTLLEKIELSETGKDESHLFFPLSNLPYPFSEDDHKQNERWEYCGKYGAMGELCDEASPDALTFGDIAMKEDSFLKSVPIIITAGSRVPYLYISLKSFLKSQGVVKSNFHVMLGTYNEQVTDILKLLDINYTYIPPTSLKDSKFISFFFYKQVYTYAVEKYKNAQYFIFLEEDVEVSPGFFSYMKQTIPLLKQDPSLYCTTGFSITGFRNRAFSEHVLLRGDIQVGYGYALTRDFVQEAVKQWPIAGITDSALYDVWLRILANNRECIFPEISFTRHFGLGTFTNHFLLEAAFLFKPLAKATTANFSNLNKIDLPSWNKDLYEKLSNATRISKILCDDNFLSSLSDKSYIACYKYVNNEQGYKNFEEVGNCFGTYTLSIQGHHDYVHTVKISNVTSVYLVGSPMSSFSSLCHSKLQEH